MKYYVGLDVHKTFTTVGVFDPASGELAVLGQAHTQSGELEELIGRVPDPKIVVLEAGRSSHWLAARLEPVAEEVWMVDPGKVRQLSQAGKKTDKRDARAIAFFAGKGLLEPICRPEAELLNLRELTRLQAAVTRQATQIRNSIRSLLARHGYECSACDLLSAKAKAYLDQVEGKLPGYVRVGLQTWRALLPVLAEQAAKLTALVQQEAKKYRPAQRLDSVPGIGAVISLGLAVEIGDPHRFPTAIRLRGYSGLVPAVSQSGARDSRGKLTKSGNKWLRYYAVLGAQKAIQTTKADGRLKRTYWSVAGRHGRNPAKVAVARQLLDLAHHLLLHDEDYQAREFSKKKA